MNSSGNVRSLFVLCIILYVLLIPVFILGRLNWVLLDNDTALITRIADSAVSSESFTEGDSVYLSGMSYTALTVFVSEITGISVSDLQSIFFPFIFFTLPIVAFIAYRALTGSNLLAGLATILIHIQAEFIFVTQRGSHEKLTWYLVFLLLFLIMKSVRVQENLSQNIVYVISFYLCANALVSTNSFFASSFISMLILSFVGGFVLIAVRKRMGREVTETFGKNFNRLFYMSLSSLLLFYLFVFYFYPPAFSSLRTLKTILDQLSRIFLSLDTGSNPYAYVGDAWINQGVYLYLTLFNWLTLLISFITWVLGIIAFLRQEKWLEERFNIVFLWLIYGALGLQLAMSLLFDTNNVISNTQVRIFTPMMIVSIPMMLLGVRHAVQNYFPKGRFTSRLLAFAALVAVFGFGFSTLLKLTNEPSLNNRWLFATKTEYAATNWAARNLENATVWVGMDDRLALAANYANPLYRERGLIFDGYVIDQINTSYYLFSDYESYRWQRLNREMPYFEDENLIYSNGSAYVYEIRPRTVYQR